MNANLFDIAERGYEAAVEMQRSREFDAAQADETDLEYFRKVVSSDPEIIRDICGCLPEAVWDAWAQIFASQCSEAAGEILSDAVFAAIEVRAAMAQARFNKRAAESAAADRFYGKGL